MWIEKKCRFHRTSVVWLIRRTGDDVGDNGLGRKTGERSPHGAKQGVVGEKQTQFTADVLRHTPVRNMVQLGKTLQIEEKW